MDSTHAKRIIEGLLFVSGQPVPLKRLREVLADPPTAPNLSVLTSAAQAGGEAPEIRQLITQLNADYVQTSRVFRIQEVAGGYQLVTDPQLAPWLKRSLSLPREDTLSKPALETLAIIAYRQPITKAEVEAIRGVDVTGTLDTLLERQFVRVAGRKETPGRPILYGTTEEFLKHFGLNSIKDLPPMGSVKTVPGLGEAAPESKPLIPPPTAGDADTEKTVPQKDDSPASGIAMAGPRVMQREDGQGPSFAAPQQVVG